jgi:AbrB family looped-hinge helix DNA binding protein
MLVEINEQGRMTIPARAREALGIDGRAQVEVEVDGQELRVRPTATIPRDDAWAYTKAHLAQVRSALDDVQAGRVATLSPQELKARISS